MFQFPVVFVDIETTGGGYRSSRVLEFAAIRYENGEITDEYATLLDPETRVPPFITKITGITDADIVGAPLFRDVAGRIAEVMEGAVFIAHNVNFDYSFIKSEFARMGAPFSMKKLCTVRLSRKLYSEERGHSLERIIRRHNIPFENRHRALDDARAIMYFSEIAHQEHGTELFHEAIKTQLKTQSTPVHLDDDKVGSLDSEPGVYIFKDGDVVLYVGKSIDIKKRVMSHFQDMSAKEVKLAQLTKNIETIPTNTEMMALLLESRLVKTLQPVHNRQLRRVKSYCMVVRGDTDYATLSYEYGIPGEAYATGSIYGLYENKIKAKKWMDVVTRSYELCPKLMGLEKTKSACFWYSLGKCKGACVEKESAAAYNQRFDEAMKSRKLEDWPYEKEIEVVIDQKGSKLVIDNWIIKNIITDIPYFDAKKTVSFDLDEYRILKKFLKRYIDSASAEAIG